MFVRMAFMLFLRNMCVAEGEICCKYLDGCSKPVSFYLREKRGRVYILIFTAIVIGAVELLIFMITTKHETTF